MPPSSPDPADPPRAPITPPDADATLSRRPPADPSRTVTYLDGAGQPAEGYLPEIPGYEIVGELGRGGMGVVYRARDLKLNREVALKMVLGGAAAGPLTVLRFLAEAEALAALHHPNVVQVYDRGQYQGLPYFTMEFCPNGSLSGRTNETQRSPREAAELVEHLARGVAAAHARGILHRDLKPANVLLAADGTPKITDFGLAKRLDDTTGMTQTGAVMGTPSYMAPEQAAGSAGLTTAADVYGLGAILYHLLTGDPPFRGSTPRETVIQVLEKEPDGVRARSPKVDRDLEAVCLKCLRKPTEERYESAAALADDLARWRAGEPTKARPLSVLERTTRWLWLNARAVSIVITFGVAWGCSIGVAVIAADLGGTDERFQFWPRSPHHPMAWGRAASQSAGLWWALAGLAILQTLAVGWMIVRAVRPKTPGLRYGFAAATGLIASVAGFLFVAPYAVAGNSGPSRFRDAGLIQELQETNFFGERFPFDNDLEKSLEKSRNKYVPRNDPELTALRERRDDAKRLETAHSGVWFTAALTLAFFLGLAVTGVWSAGLIQDRFGVGTWALVRYLELSVTTAAAVFALWLSAFYVLRAISASAMAKPYIRVPGGPYDRLFYLSGVALAVGIAFIAYLSSTRSWRWFHRAAVYFIWALLFGVYLLAWYGSRE